MISQAVWHWLLITEVAFQNEKQEQKQEKKNVSVPAKRLIQYYMNIFQTKQTDRQSIILSW